VEARVRVERGGRVASRDRGLLRIDDRRERPRQRRAVAARDDAREHCALDGLAHEQRLLDALQRQARDVGAALRADVDEAFVGEKQQRLAHRRAAHAEARREVGLGDRGAGLERDVEDRRAQRREDARALGHAVPASAASFASDR
jgi:hypothetical protein